MHFATSAGDTKRASKTFSKKYLKIQKVLFVLHDQLSNILLILHVTFFSRGQNVSTYTAGYAGRLRLRIEACVQS